MDVEWSPKMSVGVEKFDSHHKRLVAIISDFMESFEASNFLRVRQIVRELRKYAFYHLAAEEEAMVEHGYPGYDAHKKEHDEFRDFVEAFQAESADLQPEDLSKRMEFLVKWLLDHIGQTDKKYGAFFNENGIDITD